MTDPRPCSPALAVSRARLIESDPSNAAHGYRWGSGTFHPTPAPDLPWSPDRFGVIGADCAGFAMAWCYRLPRTRPGFNRNVPGKPRDLVTYPDAPTIVDDINVDSAIEDAGYAQELFAPVVGTPALGDLLVYPTIAKIGAAGPWPGHVAIVIGVDAWDAAHFSSLVVAQCMGGEDRKPAILITDGSIWDHHSATWPTRPSRLIRCVP